MLKAKFLSKYSYTRFGQHIIELEYEYRGMRYTVIENRSKGNEPLAWQHKSEQNHIDQMLDMEATKASEKPFNLEEVFKLIEDFEEK